MENKELKKPISVELNDDALESVSGGSGWLCGFCNKISTHSEMVNAGYECPYCRSKDLSHTGNRLKPIIL